MRVVLFAAALALLPLRAEPAGICSDAITAVCAKYASALDDANITSTPPLGSASLSLKATLDGFVTPICAAPDSYTCDSVQYILLQRDKIRALHFTNNPPPALYSPATLPRRIGNGQ